MFGKYITIICTSVLATSALGAPDNMALLPNYHDLITIPMNIIPKNPRALLKNNDSVFLDFDAARNLPSLSSTGITTDLMDYGLNEYVGVESEHTYLPTSAFDHMGNNINNHVIDVLGKISAPISEQLSLHAKAGLAYQDSTQPEAFDLANLHIGSAYGLEADYKMTPQLKLNLSWMRHSKEKALQVSHNQQPGSDSILLELSYQLFRTK